MILQVDKHALLFLNGIGSTWYTIMNQISNNTKQITSTLNRSAYIQQYKVIVKDKLLMSPGHIECISEAMQIQVQQCIKWKTLNLS